MEIPRGLEILSTQVAGHTFEKSLKSLGLLHDASKGFVYKPLGKPDCGERETQFYETLHKAASNGDSRSATLAEARQLVPKFYQKLKLTLSNSGSDDGGCDYTFLKLEDLTCGLALPCIMDIKIGKQTWDPLADAHKRAMEEQKYAACKQALGLCIPGFQLYAGSPPHLVRYGKEFGKQLDAKDFPDTMALFLNAKPVLCSVLVRELLRQLYSIRDWFGRQTLYHFYASSLLVLYDYEQLLALINPANGHHSTPIISVTEKDCHRHSSETEHPHTNHHRCNEKTPASQWVRVRMIDFAHVFPTVASGTLDNNYRFGLQQLIAVLENMLVQRPHPDRIDWIKQDNSRVEFPTNC